MTGPLQYLEINVKVVAMEKVSFSETQNSKVFKTLTVDEKHYLLIRDNLTQTIPIQWSQKQKTFCAFFFPYLKAILNFKHSQKEDDPHSWCISGNTGSEKYG